MENGTLAGWCEAGDSLTGYCRGEEIGVELVVEHCGPAVEIGVWGDWGNYIVVPAGSLAPLIDFLQEAMRRHKEDEG